MDRLESRLSLVLTVAGSSAMGLIGSWLSASSSWVSQFGPIGWFLSGLIAALLTALVALAAAYLRLAWVRGSAVAEWRQKVDDFNPMDQEFTRKRLKLLDLVDPVQNGVVSKNFIHCDLMGPANVILTGGGTISGVDFIGCDVVPLREDAYVQNAVFFTDCNVVGGRLVGLTIYAVPPAIPVLRNLGGNFIAYAKDELPLFGLQKGTASGMPR